MANTNCCGGTSTTTTCDSTIAELPRYYPRQLITPDDLTLEQNYFRDRMRRHNRLLHGWGVVCGAQVCPATTTNSDGSVSFTPWQVKVQKGYILGPYGDEIIIDCCRTVDLRTSGVSGVTGQPCVDTPDPWCSQVFVTPSATNTPLYIAVQYKQCMMRPVRVQPVGCGCNDNTCEYSRWHDGYEVGVLTSCPTCNACDTTATGLITPTTASSLITGDTPACPDCSCGPWVCLAEVTLSSDGLGTILQIDNCGCRRLVVSLCSAWWQCQDTLSISGVSSPAQVAAGQPASPVNVTAGQTASVQMVVTGQNLEADSNATYSVAPGVTAQVVVPASGQPTTGLTTVTLNVTAAATATPGTYNLTVTNADCNTFIFANAVTVVAPSNASATSGSPSAPTGLTGGTGGGGGSSLAKQATPKVTRKAASQTSSSADKGSSKSATT
ncbi:MAG TPA: hypothetical protein VN946_08450 [Terriglobales bacterium]|jgi:hypothetical protein|nr:hypothetical protein [Terriglobales bacterium]